LASAAKLRLAANCSAAEAIRNLPSAAPGTASGYRPEATLRRRPIYVGIGRPFP
jgi:hypothetical protein